MNGNEPNKSCGIEVAPEEPMPVVEQLLRLVEQYWILEQYAQDVGGHYIRDAKAAFKEEQAWCPFRTIARLPRR